MTPKNNNRQISIVVPVYNLENYLPGCLDSLCQQTYRNIEIIVIDDGSKDHSWSIIQKFAQHDNRIKALRQPNGGAARARNVGLEMVSGEFLMFVDGDDQLAPDTISKNISYFDNPELDWVEFPVKRVDQDGKLANSLHIGEQFIPLEVKNISAPQFISAFIRGELSRLVCGTIYRYEAVKSLRFPEKEFYEDSFYFLDMIMTTHHGIISPYGEYLYLNRDGSSQHVALSKNRLSSKVKYDLKFLSILNSSKNIEDHERKKLYRSLYYFYRLQVAKRIDGASNCFDLITNIIGPQKISFWSTLKIFIYEVTGYDNLKRAYKAIKTH